MNNSAPAFNDNTSANLQNAPDRQEKMVPAAICALTAVLYAACYRFQFVYDDREQILGNGLLDSWHNVAILFRTDVWAFLNPYLHSNYWRPLFTFWLLINKQFFGLNSGAWHVAAVLLHVLATYLVYRIALRLGSGKTTAATASLLFGVHPVHLETVAWLSGATDSLLSIFILSSFLLLLRARAQRGPKAIAAYTGSLALFALALLSKEPAMLFPFAVAGYLTTEKSAPQEASFSKRFGTAVATSAPYFAVTAIYLFLRIQLLHGFSHPQASVPLAVILLNAPILLWSYCKLLLVPVGLSVCYDAAIIISPSLKVVAACLGLCAIGGIFFVLLPPNRKRLGLLAGLWTIGFLLPVLHVPSLPKDDFLHDRYLYLPSVGFCILVSLVLERCFAFGTQRILSLPAVRVIATSAIVFLFVAALESQQIYWASDLLLFNRAHVVAPNNKISSMNLAKTLFERGYHEKAMQLFQEQQKLHPGEWYTNYNLGNAYFLSGQSDLAERYFDEAAKLTDVQYQPYARLAELRLQQQRYPEAERPARSAVRLQPYKPGFRQMLAMSLAGQGKNEEAIQELQAELARFPDNKLARTQLLQVQDRVSKRTESSGAISK